MSEATPSHEVLEATFRKEHGRVLASLIARLDDFTLAEDALQEAIIAALERWPTQGIPANPAAWLTRVAQRRAIDRLRRPAAQHTPLPDDDLLASEASETDDSMDDIPDERLKLMFTCCHPSLNQEAQVALTLKTLGGLNVDEIARAFLVSPTTMSQRLSRARHKIQQAGIPFSIPPAHQLHERLEAILAVLYLIFNEGYAATSGDTLTRRELCDEAIRLGRVLVDLLPPAPLSAEARGLLALMLLHHARTTARTSPQGWLIPLDEQDRLAWDQALIGEGLALLDAAFALHHVGPYQVQAAISALHAQASSPQDTDWPQIVALYGVLEALSPSPIISLNRAVALMMCGQWGEAGSLLGTLSSELARYHPYHVARAELLQRLGRDSEAIAALEEAIRLCQNAAQRHHLHQRLKTLTG